jgi:ATP/ADP translocase
MLAKFFWAAGSSGPWALRALYVWTGLVATLMSMGFWLLLGDTFTIAQARRLYGAIGLGSLSAQIRAAAVEHISGTLAVHVRRML